MIEKIFVLSVFLACVTLVLNLFSRGALFRQAGRFVGRLRDWPAARRRRAYLANEFRLTRERGQLLKNRSTSLH
jgi:hypothetical protein